MKNGKSEKFHNLAGKYLRTKKKIQTCLSNNIIIKILEF